MNSTPARSGRVRDWLLLTLSSASLTLALVLTALRMPFGNMLDRSLADAGWPSSLVLVLILTGVSVSLGALYGAMRPPEPGRSGDG